MNLKYMSLCPVFVDPVTIIYVRNEKFITFAWYMMTQKIMYNFGPYDNY